MLKITASQVWQFSCPYCGATGRLTAAEFNGHDKQTGYDCESHICDACGKEFIVTQN